jgi:hypothetical protein
MEITSEHKPTKPAPPAPSAPSTIDDDYAAICGKLYDTPYSPSRLRTLHEATNDPGIPISVLCECVKAAGDTGNVTIPAWAARSLAEGFNRYFKSEVLENSSMSLEHCLGFNKAAKGSSTAAITNADEMAQSVHGIRWEFGMKNIGLACRTAYNIAKEICEIHELPAEMMGITQSEKSFQQYYERNHSKQFEAWKATGRRSFLEEQHHRLDSGANERTARTIKYGMQVTAFK